MIHVYVSMPERDHDVYQHVGSVSTDVLAFMVSETLRRFGLRGRLTASVEKLPLLDDLDSRFYVLTYEPLGDDKPHMYVDRNANPIDGRRK